MILNNSLLLEKEENEVITRTNNFSNTEPSDTPSAMIIGEKGFDKVVKIDSIVDTVIIGTLENVRSIVEANTLLNDTGRIRKAEELLGPLTQEKKDAILEAHNAGNGSVTITKGPY